MAQRRTDPVESGSISDADRIGYERVARRESPENDSARVGIRELKRTDPLARRRMVRMRKGPVKLLQSPFLA
jgi:hypothetical protein